jgi:hypothetical protein
MTLLNIAAIETEAKARGFLVNRAHYSDGTSQLEIWAPGHDGPRGVWHEGSVYSNADFVVGDGPSIGYGYNPFFYGPWHHGLARDDDYGVRKLFSHPAWS